MVKMCCVAKIGPWGGAGGHAGDITTAPLRLLSVTVRSGAVVDSLAFSYLDENGDTKNAGPWGGGGGTEHKIQLGSSEFVKEISGTVGPFLNVTNLITSLTIVTNVKTYGPFGEAKGTPFRVPVQNDGRIVAFFARSGVYLDAIGVYVRA